MDVYREEILEHWQNPQNYGQMKNADLVVEQVNDLCGDAVTFFFMLANGKVKDVSFVGKGCAISVASASILTEAIKGKSVKEISKLTGKDVFALLGGPVAPARLKCAFLPLEALKQLTTNH